MVVGYHHFRKPPYSATSMGMLYILRIVSETRGASRRRLCGLRSDGGILGLVKSRLFANQAGKTRRWTTRSWGWFQPPWGRQHLKHCRRLKTVLSTMYIYTHISYVQLQILFQLKFPILDFSSCFSILFAFPASWHEVFFPNAGELEFGECALLVKSSRLEPEKNHTWTWNVSVIWKPEKRWVFLVRKRWHFGRRTCRRSTPDFPGVTRRHWWMNAKPISPGHWCLKSQPKPWPFRWWKCLQTASSQKIAAMQPLLLASEVLGNLLDWGRRTWCLWHPTAHGCYCSRRFFACHDLRY